MNPNQTRCWRILTWNVRGINASWKWDAVKDKIVQSACDIFCLQETKKDNFDRMFLFKFCPSCFDSFEFIPSMGASGGILITWKGSLFSGQKIFSNQFGLSMEFTSLHNDASWVLTCVYGPCSANGKISFLDWLKNIEMPNSMD